jgi:hypothetical protein
VTLEEETKTDLNLIHELRPAWAACYGERCVERCLFHPALALPLRSVWQQSVLAAIAAVAPPRWQTCSVVEWPLQPPRTCASSAGQS